MSFKYNYQELLERHERNKEIQNFKLMKTVSCHQTINVCKFDSTGKYFVTGGDDTKIKVWTTINSLCQKTLDFHQGMICDIVISKCNKFIISGDSKGQIFITDLLELTVIKFIDIHKEGIDQLTTVIDTTTSKNRELLVCAGGKEGIVTIFDLTFLTDNRDKPFDTKDPKFFLWKLDCCSGVDEDKMRRNKKIASVVMVPEQNLVIGGSYGGEIILFKLKQEDCTFIRVAYKCLKDCVHLLKLTNDKTAIIAASAKAGAVLWRLPASNQEFDELCKVEDTKEQGQISSRMYKNTIYSFYEYQGNIYKSTDSLAMSWDGRYIMISNCYLEKSEEKDKMIRRYVFTTYDTFRDCIQWECLIDKLYENVYTMVAHPHKKEIFVTGSLCGETKFWDVERQQCTLTFNEPPASPQEIFVNPVTFDASFSPDGNTLLVCSGRGHFSLYSMKSVVPYFSTPINQFYGKKETDESNMSFEQRARNVVMTDFEGNHHQVQPPPSVLGEFRNLKLTTFEYSENLAQRRFHYEKEQKWHQSCCVDQRNLVVQGIIPIPPNVDSEAPPAAENIEQEEQKQEENVDEILEPSITDENDEDFTVDLNEHHETDDDSNAHCEEEPIVPEQIYVQAPIAQEETMPSLPSQEDEYDFSKQDFEKPNSKHQRHEREMLKMRHRWNYHCV
ncbi:unnamed protein product [Moneuplotes crassus]|uniref:Uncharacterized protein n=1 Tax=Euplotes crassus TaxID=5936 RepID=A0AAD2DAS6_EUPCR|nr:unnamed protein product [Moneuplotes crassus]